jgi:hypothetical protein
MAPGLPVNRNPAAISFDAPPSFNGQMPRKEKFMTKKYTLAISDTVVVPVKGTLSDAGGKPFPFKFSLVCNRLGAEELKAALTGSDEVLLKEFVTERAVGWKNQTLVLEEDGQPAEFCADALAALLDISGMALLCFNAYVEESGAKRKN